MSTPPSAQSSLRTKQRRKRSAEVVSFEDLIAAHKTDRGPGELPREGVVLIAVDLELQERLARTISSPGGAPGTFTGAPNFGAPNISAPNNSPPSPSESQLSAPPDTPHSIPEQRDQELTAEPPSPTSDFAESLTPGAPHISAPVIGAPTFGAPQTTDGSPDLSTPPRFNLRDLLVRQAGAKTYAVHPIFRIQDVLTSAERDLLRWLWERGRTVPMSDRIRLVTGPNGEGARRLAIQAGLIYNTFKNLTRGLSTKLALDIVKPEHNLPTIYAIYHYSSILERQRAGGFTGVVHKNGGGRELVDSQGNPAPRRSDLTVDELERLLGALNFGALERNTGAPNSAASLGHSGAPFFGDLNKYTLEKETTTSSTANFGAPTIAAALFARTGRTDVDAARTILKTCRAANPTVEPEEIARLIRTVGIQANIQNPVGLLIRALPSHCCAESIAHYREEWLQEDQRVQQSREAEYAESLKKAQLILDSVSRGEQCDADIIQWAKDLVEKNSPKAVPES